MNGSSGVLMLLLLPFVPESPSWLISKGGDEAAAKVSCCEATGPCMMPVELQLGARMQNQFDERSASCREVRVDYALNNGRTLLTNRCGPLTYMLHMCRLCNGCVLLMLMWAKRWQTCALPSTIQHIRTQRRESLSSISTQVHVRAKQGQQAPVYAVASEVCCMACSYCRLLAY